MKLRSSVIAPNKGVRIMHTRIQNKTVGSCFYLEILNLRVYLTALVVATVIYVRVNRLTREWK